MSWVELRVHGVSGTPPEDLLARPHVRQVDGDKKSRFFRAVDSDDKVLTGDDGHTIEGYHWGRYTSGSWKQSFWLTLLPFGLVNLAAFMLPAPHEAGDSGLQAGPRRWRSAALGVLRLMALVLTVLLSFAIALTLIEVVAARWVPDQGWAKGRIRDFAPTVATLLSGAAMAVLGGWSWFSRVLGRRGDAVGLDESLLPTPKRPPNDQTSTAAAPENTSATPFASEAFYRGDPDALTLRGFHVAAGLAVPALVASIYSEQWETLSTVVLAVVLVATTLLGDKEGAAATGLEAERTVPTPWHRIAPWIAGLAVAVAAFALVASASSIHGYRRKESLDATERFVKVKGAAQLDEKALQILYLGAGTLILLTIVVVGLAWSMRSARPRKGTPAWYFRPYSKGCAAVPIAGLALFLGVGYAAALVVGASSALQQDTGKKGKPYAATAMLERVSYAWSLALVPIVLVVLVLLVQKARSKRELQRLALVGYPDDDTFPRARVKAWRTKLASAIWFARAKNGVQFIVWTLVGAGVVLSLAIVAEARPDPDTNAASFLSGTSASPHGGAILTQIGAWVLLGLVLGIVFLARGAFRDANLRRGVNIIWDIVAFWPHAVHPFIPTPYSLRTVGDLVERVRNHSELKADDGRPVVVCGHSQGSLVSFAALNLLSDEECRRVGFVTFGSQLRVIFPRAFPMYVNFEAISRMHERLDGGWVNLYRDTDPLAGPVLSWNHEHQGDGGTSQSFPDPTAAPTPDEVVEPYRTRVCGDDWRLVDPVPRVEETQEAPVNALHGHSNYWSSPVWPEALAAVRRSSVR
jgi:hypothetical protein